MDRRILNQILDIQDTTLQDETYMGLYAQFKAADEKLAVLLQRLPEEQAHVIMDYITCGAELYLRQMELACQRISIKQQ